MSKNSNLTPRDIYNQQINTYTQCEQSKIYGLVIAKAITIFYCLSYCV